MRFGRVEGIVQEENSSGEVVVRLTVYLEVGATLEIVRSEIVRPVTPVGPIGSPLGLDWVADQYTQETIGNELAEQGWEVVSQGEIPPVSSDAFPRSASYIVRNHG